VICLELQGNPAVVLIQRGRAPAKGTWSLPGGRVELGESLRDALAREVREETGLAVSVGSLIEPIEIIGDGHHFVILDYVATLAGPLEDLRAGDDAADVRVVEVEDLARYGVTPAVERVVRAAIAKTPLTTS